MTENHENQVLETGEPMQDPARKIFKGTPRVVSELPERPKYSIFQNLEIEEEAKDRRGKLPKLFILNKVEPVATDPTKSHLEYFTGIKFKKGSTYVSRDLKLQELTGRHSKSVMDKFHEDRLSNISKHLVKPTIEIGSDPEFFVVDKDDNLIPAFKFLKGKNDVNPDRAGTNARDLPGRKVYWDGFQAEFETRPETCLAYEVDSIRAGIKAIHDKAREKFPGAKVSLRSVFELTDKQMETTEAKYLELGCDPSFNAYQIKGRELNGRETAIRAAGGHMHFGIGKKSEKEVIEIVKCLDAGAGVAAVSMFEGIEIPIRREFYGLPGEYRLPPHGLEWRTPSNAWLCHPTVAHVFFDLARRFVYLGLGGLREHFRATDEEVVETILTCNAERAREIIKRNKDLYISLLRDTYNEPNRAEKAYELILNGVSKHLKDPYDLTSNWILNDKWDLHSHKSNFCWSSKWNVAKI